LSTCSEMRAAPTSTGNSKSAHATARNGLNILCFFCRLRASRKRARRGGRSGGHASGQGDEARRASTTATTAATCPGNSALLSSAAWHPAASAAEMCARTLSRCSLEMRAPNTWTPPPHAMSSRMEKASLKSLFSSLYRGGVHRVAGTDASGLLAQAPHKLLPDVVVHEQARPVAAHLSHPTSRRSQYSGYLLSPRVQGARQSCE
jgi:hypothetical protein